MKTFKLIFAVTILFFITTSCKKDEVVAPKKNEKIAEPIVKSIDPISPQSVAIQ